MFNLEFFLSIVSIITTITSIIVSFALEEQIYALILFISNIISLFILGIVIIPGTRRRKMYKNIIGNNRYYSLIYTNYIDTNKINNECKVKELKVSIDIKQNESYVIDKRRYEFWCKSKANKISLCYINDTDKMSFPKAKINSNETSVTWAGAGTDLDISGIPDIIKIANIPLHNNSKFQEVFFEYQVEHKLINDKFFIYIIYPKMFSNKCRKMQLEININDSSTRYNFKLISIGENGEKSEGLINETSTNRFMWKGSVNKRKLYIIKGTKITSDSKIKDSFGTTTD